MRPLGHIAITFTLGSLLYSYSHSFVAFLWLLITGIFADADHYFDYIREYGLSFNIKKVYNACDYPPRLKKITILFHSYEILILLWLIIALFELNIIWKYAATGLTLHLLLDQITNPVFPPAYFLSFRIANNFESSKILHIAKGVYHANRHR